MAAGRKTGGGSAVFSWSFRMVIAGAMAILSSCNCNPPLRITPIQREDKKMDCAAIVMEMTEAEFYRTLAESSAKKSMMKIYAPVCMVWGQADSWSAYGNASDRLEYLGRIYTLLDCDGKLQGGGEVAKGSKNPAGAAPAGPSSAPPSSPRPPAGYYAPPAGYYAPVPFASPASAPAASPSAPAASAPPSPPRPPAGYYAPPAGYYAPAPSASSASAPPSAAPPSAASGAGAGGVPQAPAAAYGYPPQRNCCSPSCYYCSPYAAPPAR